MGTVGGREAAVGRNTAASVVVPLEGSRTEHRGCTPVALEAAHSSRVGIRGRASPCLRMRGTAPVVGWSLEQTEGKNIQHSVVTFVVLLSYACDSY